MPRKKKKEIDLSKLTRQELGRLNKRSWKAWVTKNAAFYMDKCFKQGDWVMFREAELSEQGHGYAPHQSVKVKKDGKFYVGRVRIAFIQKTGRIQRYWLTYYGKGGKILQTPRGINQVVAATPQEIQAVTLMVKVKGYDELYCDPEMGKQPEIQTNYSMKTVAAELEF